LPGKVALIAGQVSGRVVTMARAFAAEGARVLLADSDEQAAAAAAATIGGGAIGLRLDPREELSWIAAMARALDGFGRLDLLLHDATVAGDAGAAPLDDWHAAQRARIDALFLGSRHAIRTMRRGAGGVIVTVVAGGDGSAAALAAGHCRRVARYCRGQGLPIRCNTLHASGSDPGVGDEQVAAAALLLASDGPASFDGAALRLGRL